MGAHRATEPVAAGSPPSPNHLGLVRHPLGVLALSLVTGGTYALLWVYRASRLLELNRRQRLLMTGLFAVPFVGVLPLYAVVRAARGEPPSRPERLLPGFFLGCSFVLLVTGGLGLLSVWLVVLSGSAALGAYRAGDRWPAVEAGPRGRINPIAAGAALGLVMTSFLWLGLDELAALQAWTQPSVVNGRFPLGSTGLALCPAGEWKALPTGTRGDDDALLELTSANGDSWVVAYDEGRSSFDLLASLRRAAIRDTDGIIGYDARRQWDEHLGIVSRAEIDTSIYGSPSYYGQTIFEQDGRWYEIIGYTARAKPAATEVLQRFFYPCPATPGDEP